MRWGSDSDAVVTMRFILRPVHASALFSAVLLLISCRQVDNRTNGTVRDTQASFTVTATGLAQAYANDATAADRRYKDKVIYLTGQVENVESDLMDSYLVSLRTGVNWGDLVSCKFPKTQEEHLTRLTKGSYVRIKGRCAGKAPVLTVADCVLVDEKGSPLGG